MSFVPFTSNLATLSNEHSYVLFINTNIATTSEFRPGCSTDITSLLDVLLHLPTTSNPQSTCHFPPHFFSARTLVPSVSREHLTPYSDIEVHSISSLLPLYMSISKWLCVCMNVCACMCMFIWGVG